MLDREALLAEQVAKKLPERVAASFFKGQPSKGPYLREDGEADARLALVKAARDFDPARSGSFEKYAACVVWQALVRHFQEDRLVRVPQKAYQKGFRYTSCCYDEDTLAAPEPGESPEESLPDYLAEALRKLTAHQREAVERVVLGGESHGEVARSWGRSEKAAYNARAKGLANLKKSLTKE